jgi:hypothetical protein
MSTPSGTSFDPSDPSHYAPKKRERSASDQPSTAPREQSTAPGESSPGRDAAPAQPSGADAPREERGATPDPVTDTDLQRLETSLRWLQREGSTGRLPRAVQLPPVSGLRHAQADGAKQDHFIDGFRLPSSLAPERVRVPPLRERSNPLRGSLRVLVVSVVAIPVAYYISFGAFSLPWSSPAAPAAAPAECCTTSTQLQVPKDPVRVAAVRPARKDDADIVAAAPPVVTNAAPAPAPASDRGPAPGSDRGLDVSAAPVQPEAEPAAAPPAAPPGTRLVKTVRELDPEAVKLLMQQGQQFVAAGDFVTARIVFQRAAEAGDATAALAMGATFDPTMLAKLGARGVIADVDKARFWYQKAQAFGSPEAPHRIEMLANR